jgi:6-phosphogluconolactonase (cycloisomerase 2 family)
LGPRYIEFHPTIPTSYVINELSCEVCVFQFDSTAAQMLQLMHKMKHEGKQQNSSEYPPTLRLIQTIRTVPEAFPTDMNTCGRIAVHNSGSFVLAANRGHDSIAVFQVDRESDPPGQLELVDIQHTRGKTPRHFKFDSSGQWLLAANQDTDTVSIFHFNIATGKLNWTGNHYHVSSPNFVEVINPSKRMGTSEEPPSSKRARAT